MTPDAEALAIATHALREARRGLLAAHQVAVAPGIRRWLGLMDLLVGQALAGAGRMAERDRVVGEALAVVKGARVAKADVVEGAQRVIDAARNVERKTYERPGKR